MYLTKFSINPSRTDDRNDAHRDVQRLFGSNRIDSGALYRIQNDTMYVLSKSQPIESEYSQIVNGMRLEQMCNADRIEKMIENGATLRFDVECNPMKHQHSVNRKPIRNEDEQIEWLTQTFKTNGISVENVAVVSSKCENINRKGNRWKIEFVRYGGTIRIVDAEKAKAMWKQGIGRSRAYGGGLLMIAK